MHYKNEHLEQFDVGADQPDYALVVVIGPEYVRRAVVQGDDLVREGHGRYHGRLKGTTPQRHRANGQ